MCGLRSYVALLLLTATLQGHGSEQYLREYLSGYVIGYAYGSGVSSSLPRVEMQVHYCANGRYYSNGRSCRPNVIARGHQCTPFQDSGQWQVGSSNGQIGIRWLSASGTPGELGLRVAGDGSVADYKGNQLLQMGAASCGF